MHRRIGFVIAACGMIFAVLPFTAILGWGDLITCTIGFALILIGAFFAIESVAKSLPQKK